MKINRILGATLCSLTLLCGLITVPASAAEVSPGVYTASMVTTYYNPDTGNVDDGGTANAALGEGMCRSATDKTALVEVDSSGNVWVTVRLLLQSNCSNIALYSRSGYDSYKQLSYNIIAEDAGNDSIDYRIKVSEPGQKLKCTMYVTPMGRDVLWYLYVDTSTLKSGSGDFVVSIDTSSNNTQSSTVTTPAAGASGAGTSSGGTSSAVTTDTAAPGSTASGTTESDTQGSGDVAGDTGENGSLESEEDGEPAEGDQELNSEKDASKKDADGAIKADTSSLSDKTVSEGLSSTVIAGIVIVVILLAVGAVVLVRRKKAS